MCGEKGGHYGRSRLKTYCRRVEEKDAKTTVEQSTELWASQHCLPSSFINVLLEYSSTQLQRHPPREREINRALYHPDTQQCITAFVIIVTWISSIINRWRSSIPLVCLFHVYCWVRPHKFLLEDYRNMGQGCLFLFFLNYEPQCGLKKAVTLEPDH